MKKNYFKIQKLISIFVFVIPIILQAETNDLFLGASPSDYLTGRAGNKMISFQANGRTHLFRPDAKQAFDKMVEDYEKFRKEEEARTKKKIPPIKPISAFRSYSDQKGIWDNKFTGQRKMKKSVEGKSPEEKVKIILEYSSAPATSRHHWGTDIDINALDNSYFEENGEGAVLYKWLQANAEKYGFCQPYTPYHERNNQGYFQENWHWSYAPVSQKLVREWKKLYEEKGKSLLGKIEGIEAISPETPLIYVTSVNKKCDEIERNWNRLSEKTETQEPPPQEPSLKQKFKSIFQ